MFDINQLIYIMISLVSTDYTRVSRPIILKNI